MDSRRVTTLIRRLVWPALEECGFGVRTGRTAWRHWDEGVDVVNFQALGAYIAAVIGCTPFSFAANRGVWLDYLPRGEPRERGGRPAPEEYECHFRGRVDPGRPQPRFAVGGTDAWYLAPDGSDAEPNVADAASAVLQDALPWFDRFRDHREVLRTLVEDEERMGETWGFGAPGSPVRRLATAYAAIHCGELGMAEEELAALLRDAPIDRLFMRPDVDAALGRLEAARYAP